MILKTSLFWKNIGSNVLYYCRALYFLIKYRGIKGHFLFYPQLPSKRTTIYKICFYLGYNFSNHIQRKSKLAFHWENKTHSSQFKVLDKLHHIKVLNKDCTDISKKNIGYVFEQVFGYKLLLDPLKHTDKCVEKSDANAVKDGKIIQCPVEQVLPDKVYQVLVNNYADDGCVMDIRVPVIGQEIPFVYLKYKEHTERFTNETTTVTTDYTGNVLSGEEVSGIIRFCSVFQLDFGELDVLRDYQSGLIYIVDVNPTPWGPHQQLSKNSKKWAVEALSMCFYRVCLNA